MNRQEILEELTDRNLLIENDHVILVDGFEEAFLGITAGVPVKATYDYWVCLDLLIQRDEMEFDFAIDSLDEFINQDLGEHTPLYLKLI
jgi:hypothetical protein|tara:strand:+ start:1204 stop:1470 length:267 start_codon:yes stop_codon:yes gene_type:complete